MKTIQEASREFASEFIDNECRNIVIKSFIEAVKFAEEWLPIERDDDGCITDEQQAEMILNIPFFTKDKEDDVNLFYSGDWSILDNENVTHWRPINRK